MDNQSVAAPKVDLGIKKSKFKHPEYGESEGAAALLSAFQIFVKNIDLNLRLFVGQYCLQLELILV